MNTTDERGDAIDVAGALLDRLHHLQTRDPHVYAAFTGQVIARFPQVAAAVLDELEHRQTEGI